jgi:demethylmenaquinone methyltransferase/2-methoxy-6-polyprenyl-1,4-benzoquinol methylase
LANKYLAEGSERAPKVREMFSRLAERYDLVNDIMSLGLHRPWKRQTVRLALAPTRGARVLDLCCGTGDLAFRAEEGGARQVVGADFTLPMLAVARRRRSRRESRISLVQADALALPFRDGSFDAITIAYGLRNIAEPERALSEMRRVLAPGGRLAVLDFGKPSNRGVNAIYQAFLRTMMPAVGWIFHGDPETYLYIPESLKIYPGQRGVEQMMRETGLSNVRVEERLFGVMGINLGEAPPL